MSAAPDPERDRRQPRRWLRSYPPDIDWFAPIATRSVPELFAAAAAVHAERPCLHFMGRTWSYREVDAWIERTARGLAALGVGPGVTTALLLPNVPHYVVCYHAVLRAGGTVANLNPLYSEHEVEQLLRLAAARLVVTVNVASLHGKATRAQQLGAVDEVIVCDLLTALPRWRGALLGVARAIGGWFGRPGARLHRAIAPGTRSFAATLAMGAPFTAPTIDPARDVAVLQFTGGTTGLPKAAMLTHANVTANVQQVRAIAPGLRAGAERALAVLPLCHAFAMTVAMNLMIELGGAILLLPRFDLDHTLRVIARRRPTVLPGVPAMFAALVERAGRGQLDLRSLDYCISGGAALPAAVREQFESLTGCELVEGYGLSECSPVATCNLFDGRRREGSIGLPLPGTELQIREPDTEREVGVDERGEICIRGPQVMLGYRAAAAATAATIRDGWLRTGDIGRMDEDGYTFLVDRIKDVIIRDGYKIYPRVVEEAIARHPGVAEVIVVGIADARRGAVPKAFVQRTPGADLDADALRAFLTPRLSPVEIPLEVEFLDQMPRTILGKPDRRALQ